MAAKKQEPEDFKSLAEKYNFKPLSSFEKLESTWDVYETGVLPLDMAMGDLGPDGRLGVRARSIVEIAGFSNTGKSSVLAQWIKTTIDRYGPESVVGLFTEPPDFNTFRDKGVNLDDLAVRVCYDPDVTTHKNMIAEQLEGMRQMCKLPQVKLGFVDSVAASVSEGMLFEGSGNNEKEVGAKTVASLANIYNDFLAKFQYQTHSAALCLINHYKEKLWADQWAKIKRESMGSIDQYDTKGGTGIYFFARRRCMLKGFKQMEDKDERHSVENTKSPDIIKINYDVYKRKGGSPRSTIGYLSMIDGKFNNEECLIDYASFFGTRTKIKEGKTERAVTISELDPKISSSGSWVYIGDEKFQGKDAAVQYLKQNPDVYEKLKYQVYARHEQYFADERPNASTQLDG